MANNINTPVNNIISEGITRPNENAALVQNTRVLRTQDSLNIVRSQATSQTYGAASRVGRNFVSRSSPLVTRSPVNSPASSEETFLTNQKLVPVISILGGERVGPGFTFHKTDGSTTTTSINEQGLYQELSTNADRSSSTAVYQDLPLDQNGSPTGYRVTTTQKNSNGRVTGTQQSSMLITDLGDGRLVGTFVDLTDPTNPQNRYNSVLTLSAAVNDTGNPFYNSQTTFPDGSGTSKTYEQLNFGTGFNPKMPKGYLEHISNKTADGTVTNFVLKTQSETDAQGNRVTSITNVTDPNNPMLISQSSKPDPFIRATRNYGTQMSEYLDYLSQAGYLDITGDGKNDPKVDLLLINRYGKGLRGNALIANLNLGSSTASVASMEAKLNEAFSRGLYDINGNKDTDSSQRAKTIDINLIARYMFGARNSALTDSREANDDSITISSDGSNIVALADNDPLLNDFKQIFNIDGIDIKTSSQQLKVFYVSLEQTGPAAIVAGRVVRSNNSSQEGFRAFRSGSSAPVLNDVSKAADASKTTTNSTTKTKQSTIRAGASSNSKAITRLGDLTSSSFEPGETDPADYGLGPLASTTTGR